MDANNYYEIAVRKNHNIEIECTAVGNPVAEIIWKKHRGQNIQYLTPDRLQLFPYNVTSVLKLKNLLRKDAGNYSCDLPRGMHQQKMFGLNVQSAPSQPVIIDVRLGTMNSIQIYWYLADDGGSKLQNVFLEWAANFTVSPSDIHNLTVSLQKNKNRVGRNYVGKNYITSFGIHLPDESSVRIQVENSIGKSAASKLRVIPHRSQNRKASQFSMSSIKIIIIISVVLLSLILIIAFILK